MKIDLLALLSQMINTRTKCSNWEHFPIKITLSGTRKLSLKKLKPANKNLSSSYLLPPKFRLRP